MDNSSNQVAIVYMSFDRFPAAKGAATHINAFVTALGRRFGNVDLVTIQSETDALRSVNNPQSLATASDSPPAEFDSDWNADGVTHHAVPARGENLFERVLFYRSEVLGWWRRRFQGASADLPIVHFRSIFEGYPIARQKRQFCRKLIFEVNGLPSIELKYRYPNVADDNDLQRKILWQEQVCLDAADLIVTVSRVNEAHLIGRGVPKAKICVIPNGVDTQLFDPLAVRSDHVERSPETFITNRRQDNEEACLRLLYAGTMSAWQGVRVAIEALRLARRDFPAFLTLVGPSRPRQQRALLELATDLGVQNAIRLLPPVDQSQLAALHQEADVVLAPLIRNDRNVTQGCCPLKVLEAMASGKPLIASDLPVVRELVTDGEEGLLVRPGSPKAIKDALLRLRSDVDLARHLGERARARAVREFTWQRAQSKLIQAYEELLCMDDD